MGLNDSSSKRKRSGMDTGADAESPRKRALSAATISQSNPGSNKFKIYSPKKSGKRTEHLSSVFEFEEESLTKRLSASNPSPKSKKLKESSTPQKKDPDSSSPSKTSGIPHQASSMGVDPTAAKTLLKYASKLKPLVLMLYETFRMAVEKKELPSQKDFMTSLDKLAKSMVSFLEPFQPFWLIYESLGKMYKKSFSDLSDEDFDAMLLANNVHVAGDFEFAVTKMMNNMEIPNSLIEQIQFLTPINVTSVCHYIVFP